MHARTFIKASLQGSEHIYAGVHACDVKRAAQGVCILAHVHASVNFAA